MNDIARTQGFVGIDIGGTNTRIALFESLDSPVCALLTKFPTYSAYEQQLQTIVSAINESGLTSIAGIGVSIGGRIAKDGRSVIVAPNLPNYINKPFVQSLSLAFNCPVRLAHDAVCGLIAEKKFGHIAVYERCAYLTVSTGTGCAFQLRKASITLTTSIEIGHQILEGNSLVCLCGQTGCLETFTGGKQLELRYGSSTASITDPLFWQTFCDKLALGLINLAQLTRVEALAISGGIALNNPFILTMLQHRIDSTLKGASLALSYATLKEDAPIAGAALLLGTSEDTILH